MARRDSYVPGSGQGKHPTRATKLDLLQFVAGCPGADVVTVTQRFGLSDIGARCKLWRLTKQRLLETIPHTYGRTKAWQLTRAGRRHLRYLKEAEDYGGTKGLLVSNLTAEVARLKAENDYRNKVIEERPGILQEAAGLANENLALERALATASTEIERLRVERRALLAVIAQRRGR